MSRYVIRNNVHYGTVDEMINTIKAQAAEIERLRGDLAKAVESLGRISDDESWQANEARDTLAELTRGKP